MYFIYNNQPSNSHALRTPDHPQKYRLHSQSKLRYYFLPNTIKPRGMVFNNSHKRTNQPFKNLSKIR